MALTKVTAGVIAANAVVDSFGTQSITGDKLDLNSINANNIVDGVITNAKLAGSITGDKIGVGQITANLFAAGAVTATSIYDGTSNVSIASTDGNVIIGTAGTEKVRVDTNGNVGIGTSSGTSKLTIYGGSGTGFGHFNYANSVEDGAYPLIGSFNNANASSATYGWGFYDSNSNGNLVLYRRAGSTTGVKTAEFNRTNGDFGFNSGFGSVSTVYGCRAWVNFNGQGTVAINASGNVSSITDNGTGDYTVNLTTAMPDTNYSYIVGGKEDESNNSAFAAIANPARYAQTTSAFRVVTRVPGGAAYDFILVSAAVFR